MKLNETDAALRRVYFVVKDVDGILVADAVTGAPAGTIQTSSNGDAALANASGTFAAVGGGLHYYEATTDEAAVGGFLWVKFERTGYLRTDVWATVGDFFQLDQTDAALLRLPVLITVDGDPATGADAAVPLTIDKSTNGDAFATADGTLVEISDGVYYYQGVAADAAVEGFIAIKIDPNTYDLAIAYASVSPQATGVVEGPVVVEPTPIPVSITTVSDVTEVDHIEVALERLPRQFRGVN